MRILGAFCRKEWREHRAIAIGLLLALPLLYAMTAFALPERALADREAGRIVALIGGLAAMAIALFAITSDLFSGKVRSGRIAFLDRFPAGLTRPFAAKALVFVVGVGGFFLYGFQLAAWIVAWRGGEAAGLADMLGRTLPTGAWRMHANFAWVGLLVLLALPVSCFAPRGVLTLPLTALIGALVVGPAALSNELLPREPAGRWFLAALLLVAAWLAFVRGYRAGGRWPRVMKWGVIVLLFAPLTHGMPVAKAFFLERGWIEGRESVLQVYLGRDGRYLYVERAAFTDDFVGTWLAPLRIDTASGEIVKLERARLSVLGNIARAHQPVPQPYLGLDHGVLDTATGESASVYHHEAASAVSRATSNLLTADGERMWIDGTRIVWKGGGVELGRGIRNASPVGVALSVGHGFFDPYRLAVEQRHVHGLAGWRVVIRRGAWLVKAPRDERWQLYDPDARTLREAGSSLGWNPIALDDGRVLVHASGEPLRIVDPESVRTTDVTFEDGSPALASRLSDASLTNGGAAVRDDAGRRVFWLGSRLARLEGARLVRTADAGATHVMLIGCAGDRRCFARTADGRVVELEFGGETVRVLYEPD